MEHQKNKTDLRSSIFLPYPSIMIANAPLYLLIFKILKIMENVLTFQELYRILITAANVFKEEYEKFEDEDSKHMYYMCKDMANQAIQSDSTFFTIKEDEPF